MTPDSSQAPLASGVRSLLIGAGALCAIVVVSVVTATVFHAGPSRRGAYSPARAAASGAGLGLRAEVRGGSLQVSWNHDAAPVRNATSGSLTFQDGESRKTLQLSQTSARAGTVFYAARGTQVQVALTIFAPDHVLSESISAAVPASAAKSDLAPAGETGSEGEERNRILTSYARNWRGGSQHTDWPHMLRKGQRSHQQFFRKI